jgi:hypothetical protein
MYAKHVSGILFMEPILPTWFKYRQGKAEPAGSNVLKLTAPNLPEAYIAIRAAENGNYQGVYRTAVDGPDVAVTQPDFVTPGEAWGAAFELYRTQIVVGSSPQGSSESEA